MLLNCSVMTPVSLGQSRAGLRPRRLRPRLVRDATFLEADRREIALRRGSHNRLGFAYQVAFVRVLGRFSQQTPLEIDGEILRFAALQLGADAETIHAYASRQQTVSEHQQRIGEYLRLRAFDAAAGERLARFLEDEALRLERIASLLARARAWLRDLDALVAVDDDQPHSPLNRIKASSSNPSVGGMKRLPARLELIEATGVLGVDVDWVNGNYQRILFHSVRTASADRVRRMAAPRRHLALVCFLHQTWRDTLDQAVDMYGKLLDRNRKLVETRLDDMLKAQRQAVDRITLPVTSFCRRFQLHRYRPAAGRLPPSGSRQEADRVLVARQHVPPARLPAAPQPPAWVATALRRSAKDTVPRRPPFRSRYARSQAVKKSGTVGRSPTVPRDEVGSKSTTR